MDNDDVILVYNYDGMVAPSGGEPGVENPRDRVASPLARLGWGNRVTRLPGDLPMTG